MMTHSEFRTCRIQSSDTKCYETKSKNRIKDRSMTYELGYSRGRPHLYYINEKLSDDLNENTSFLYIGVQGSQYNRSRHNNNNVSAHQ